MKTFEEVLEIEGRIDRAMLEEYIEREWLRPISYHKQWHFEEIDIARLRLVYHLKQEININTEGMDVVLSLLDQLYGARTNMQKLLQAIARQPQSVQTEIEMIIKELANMDAPI